MLQPRSLPSDTDLLGVTGWLVLAWAVALVPILEGTLLASAVALGALLLLPGYTLVAALFPTSEAETGPTGTERFLFAVAASVALAMVLGVVLSVSGLGFSQPVVLAGVTVLAVGFAIVAVIRRRQAGDETDTGPNLAGLRSGWRPDDRVLTVGLVALVVLAVLWVGVIGIGIGGESLTEAYLLTETGDGYKAGGYPTNFESGETRPVQVGVENHRDRAVTYSVVVVQQRVASDDPTVVREQSVLDRFTVTAQPGTERIREHGLAPTMTGDVRVRYLFYEGEAPATVDADGADHSLQLWVDVGGEGATGDEG